MCKKDTIVLGNVEKEKRHQSGNVYGVDCSSLTIMCGTHGYGFGYFIDVKKIGEIDYDTDSLQSK